jgi:hypothetical protein
MRVSRTCQACGYTADYASAPLADAHHRRHSCAKHRRGLDQAARRAERLQARVPRECTHPQARHRHGTRAAYVKDRCRCAACTAANTAASRIATRERIYGRWRPYVDAGPVREHIAALRAAGIGVERIAHLAGLSVSHIRELAQDGRGDSPGHAQGPSQHRHANPGYRYRPRAPGAAQPHRRHRHPPSPAGAHRHRLADRATGGPAEPAPEQPVPQHDRRVGHRPHRPRRRGPL